jgi:hypothetical protein
MRPQGKFAKREYSNSADERSMRADAECGGSLGGPDFKLSMLVPLFWFLARDIRRQSSVLGDGRNSQPIVLRNSRDLSAGS